MYIFNSFYLLHSYNPSFLWHQYLKKTFLSIVFICLCFNMVSFRGQKKLGPRPDRSLLGVQFKIYDEHPYHLHMRSPPLPGLGYSCQARPVTPSETIAGHISASVTFPFFKWRIQCINTLNIQSQVTLFWWCIPLSCCQSSSYLGLYKLNASNDDWPIW